MASPSPPRSQSWTRNHRRLFSLDFMSTLAEAAPRDSRQRAGVPRIDVNIDGHFTSKVYTSGSTISGHVVINAPRDVAFDEVEILFVGTAYTRLDFVQQYATHSARPFMKLRMPVRESDLPNPRVFQAGRTYTVPFNFVVPHQLTIGACNHKCHNDRVREQHLRLPPSMGNWVDNDQAPDMAHIEYAIRAHALRATGTAVMEGQRVLRMMPSLPEDAPLDITDKDERYQLAKTKTIRKNLMTTKVGKMTVHAPQPGAVVLAADAYSMSGSSLRLNLAFSPTAADMAPPKINSISAKLQSTTFFSSVPMEQLPNLGSRDTYRVNPTLNYSTHTAVALPALEKVNWRKQSAALVRRDSGYSSWPDEEEKEEEEEEEEASGPDSGRRDHKKQAKRPLNYAATLDIPFTLPTQNHKLFLPTFHSCLISRTYTLHVTLSAGPLNTTFSLSVPLQVAVENVHQPQVDDDLPSFESAMAEAQEEIETDAYLQPRLIQVPSARYQGNSVLPEYEAIARRSVAVV